MKWGRGRRVCDKFVYKIQDFLACLVEILFSGFANTVVT